MDKNIPLPDTADKNQNSPNAKDNQSDLQADSPLRDAESTTSKQEKRFDYFNQHPKKLKYEDKYSKRYQI